MTFDVKRVFEPDVSVWFGAAAPICAFNFIIISIALSPWFSWVDNALSDLGVSSVAPIFNTGLILTGTLLVLFAIGLVRAERGSRYGFASAIGFLVAGFGVMGVGVFTEAVIYLHVFFAMLCFIPLLLSCVLFGLRWALRRGISRSTILATLILLGALGVISGLTVAYFMNPLEFIELYRNPPPQYYTPEGAVDYLRIGAYMREMVETRYGIAMPGIALMEILFALPIIPLYILLSVRLYRKKS